MPDTPGKRQRDAQKVRRRQVKEERRTARKAARDDPMPYADGEQIEGDEPIDPAGPAEDVADPVPEPTSAPEQERSGQ